MTSALTRRGLVITSLPFAALATASTKVIGAGRKPDAELLRLGEALTTAWPALAASLDKLGAAA